MIDYVGNKIMYYGDCPACSYASYEFKLPCGRVYEDEVCIVSQDWELPINGMMIVSSNRHVEQLTELTSDERTHIFNIVNKTIVVLRSQLIVNEFNVLFEEKKGIHFHIWILPRDEWVKIGIDPTKDLRKVMDYAKANLRKPEVFDEIKKTSEALRRALM